MAMIVYKWLPALQGDYHSLPGDDCVQEVPSFKKSTTFYRRFPAFQEQYHSLPGVDCIQKVPRPSGRISQLTWR